MVLCGGYLLFCSGLVSAVTIYVDQASGDNNHDGLTPATAVATVTQGASLVSQGDTLNIGSGTYSTSTGESYPIQFSNSINLSGAGPGQTILDGAMQTGILAISGNLTVANIDNLTVTNGVDLLGGGLWVSSVAALNLSHCVFSNNDAQVGGAVIVYDTPNINVTNCSFDNNNATAGSGMQIQINADIDVLMAVRQTVFSNNTGSSALQFQENGDGDHTLNIDQSTFINPSNHGVNYTNANTTQSFGLVSNSLFIGHTSQGLSMVNTHADVVNVTFVGNNTALTAGAQARIVNSIFWDNNINLRGSGGHVSYSIIEGLDMDDHIDGGNNLDVDPLLGANYRLTQNSPAIDMGSDQIVNELGLLQDIDLKPRQTDYSGLNHPEGVVDIGADEIQDLIFADGFNN